MSEALNAERLADEITAAAERARDDGSLPLEVEKALDAPFRFHIPPPARRRALQRMRIALDLAEERAWIDEDVPPASDRALLTGVKKGVQNLVGWYVGAIAGRIRGYADADLQTMKAAAEALQRLEDDVSRLELTVAELRERLREITAGRD